MKNCVIMPVLAFVSIAPGWSQRNPHASLSRGVISYVAEDGKRQQIDVRRPCADLWVSPDGRVITFIAIEKSEPPTPAEPEPFIKESSVYIARASDHFKPVAVGLKPVLIDGNLWTVFRNPSLSPDLQTVYFLVPYTATTWKLMRRALSGGIEKPVEDAMAYCVIWGGEHSGDLLTSNRQDSISGRPATGVTYPCYLSGRSGEHTMVADGVLQDCWAFDDFSTRWSREHGGACRL